MKAWLGCLALALLLCAGPAEAQDRVLLETRAPAAWLDVEALRARLGELTGAVIVSSADSPASVLTIAMRGEHRAHVELSRADGRRIARTVTLPEEPSERVETLAILAMNLLRDEAAELLALLRPRAEGESPAPTVEAEVEVALEPSPPEVAPTDAAIEAPIEPGIETPIEPAEAPIEAPIEPAIDAPIEAPAIEAPIAPSPPFLRIGASAHLGSVPRGTGYDVDLLYGFELAWTAPELLAIGVRELTVGGLPSGRDGIRVDLAPFVELGWTYAFFTLYGQLGAHTQVVVDFGVNEHFGVAALGVVGVRFRVAPVFSIGLETALRVVASEQFTTALHDLPQLSVPWTGGLSLLFHVS